MDAKADKPQKKEDTNDFGNRFFEKHFDLFILLVILYKGLFKNKVILHE